MNEKLRAAQHRAALKPDVRPRASGHRIGASFCSLATCAKSPNACSSSFYNITKCFGGVVSRDVLPLQGLEYTEYYAVEYQRQENSPWKRFHNRKGDEVAMTTNTNLYTHRTLQNVHFCIVNYALACHAYEVYDVYDHFVDCLMVAYAMPFAREYR